MTRRTMLGGAVATAVLPWRACAGQASGVHFNVAEFDRARILRLADRAAGEAPVVLTSATAPGARDPHRFFCDAAIDMTTDEVSGYTTHADLLARMTARVAALIAAWRLTGKASYLQQAQAQLRAWCIAPATRMAPTLENDAAKPDNDPDLRQNSLRFTLPLAEFARAAAFVCAAPATAPGDADALRAWAAELLRWFSDSDRGSVAAESSRADAIFWTMQASELARFTRNEAVLRECNHRFRDKLLRQLHLDGYFPYVLAAKRAYAESMLLLECMGSACESVSTPFESAWNFALPDGRGMRAAIAWAAPLLQSRSKWPYPADVRHFSEQPFRENALLFAARAWNRPEYAEQWKAMKLADDASVEVQREHPVTQPALWAVRPPV